MILKNNISGVNIIYHLSISICNVYNKVEDKQILPYILNIIVKFISLKNGDGVFDRHKEVFFPKEKCIKIKRASILSLCCLVLQFC